MEIKSIAIRKPEEINFIFGQSHFIKTVEDLYEICITSSSTIRFGVAFCEASGPCLIRHAGNDEELLKLAVENAQSVGAGHTFFIFMKNAFPINILNQVKSCQEVCRIFCATANPVRVLIAEESGGRGVLGVIDGEIPKGVETPDDVEKRQSFLRAIGYKK
ncbi:MAG: adenosine-specific kinase [Candidatus Wallbacteria bacterium]|nr:adenosine-specific kinase [Candidatus Wallbacteria bacterium]